MEESLTIADRIVLMNRGRVEQVGTASDIYERPATEFAASFVGTTNLLTGLKLLGPTGTSLYAIETRTGRRLEARMATGGTPAGSMVSLSVRPEKVYVGRSCGKLKAEHAEQPNSFSGTALSRTYIGPIIRWRVRVGDDLEFLVDEQNRGPARVEVGDQVRVWWDPQDSFVVASQQPTQ